MRLVELGPFWFTHEENPRAGFLFLCPHCRAVFLSCKSVPMTRREQCAVFRKIDRVAHATIVTSRDAAAWSIDGEFDALSVMPSIDASASGHWHGYVTKGEIVGGL